MWIKSIKYFNVIITGISWASSSMATWARCCRTDRVTCERFLWGGRPSAGVCVWCPWARIGHSRNSRNRPVRLEEEHRVQIRLVQGHFDSLNKKCLISKFISWHMAYNPWSFLLCWFCYLRINSAQKLYSSFHKYCNDMPYHRFWHGGWNIVSPDVCIATHSFFQSCLIVQKYSFLWNRVQYSLYFCSIT